MKHLKNKMGVNFKGYDFTTSRPHGQERATISKIFSKPTQVGEKTKRVVMMFM